MTFCGFLLKLGYLNFWPLYGVLMAGDLTGDIFWYGVGYFYARPFTRRFGRFFGLTEALLVKAESAFEKHDQNILFFSKITMGFGFALVTLMAAGMARVPLKKFMIVNALGQCVWTGLLLSIGYFFGDLYLTFNEGIRDVSLAAFAVIVIVAVFGLGRYLRGRHFSDLP